MTIGGCQCGGKTNMNSVRGQLWDHFSKLQEELRSQFSNNQGSRVFGSISWDLIRLNTYQALGVSFERITHPISMAALS